MRFLLVTYLCLTPSALALDLDERPAAPGDWGYRPTDKSHPALNPPGFTWRPVADATYYRLQIATTPDFSHVYREWTSPWGSFCSDRVIPPGVYFWRYAAGSDDSLTAWSQVRTFTMDASATMYPRPTIEDLIGRMPTEHPRLFMRPEQLPELRELAYNTQELGAKKWSSLHAYANRLLANPPDTSEPPLYPVGTISKSKEWKDIWWGNRRRMIAVADGAATLAFAYRISGDERYGMASRDLLLALCEWDPEGSTQYRYNDEAAMPALYMASRAYDWAYPVFTSEERSTVIGVMAVRGKQCFDHLRARRHLWRPYSSHSNRAWHFLGELAIAFHGDMPEAKKWLDYSMTIQYTAYPVWGGLDGGWHEGIAYWSSYLNRFTFWADTIRAAFDIDVYEHPFFRHTGYYGMYHLPPGTQTAGFGDQTTTVTSKSIAKLIGNFAVGAQNPHWQWYAEQHNADLGSGYLGFLRAVRHVGLKSSAPVDLPTSKVFNGVGVGVLNTNLLDASTNTQLVFKSSPLGRASHGYNANNAFLLNLRGQPVFVRSGRRDVYASPHHQQWMWHTQSDNAILVNGKTQLTHSSRAVGRITDFLTSDTVDVIVGETNDANSGLTSWTRRIVFMKPHAILIHDNLAASTPSSFQWLLHAKGAFDIEDNVAKWSGDAGTVSVHFLTPADLTITQTDQFDPPPAEWTGWDLGEWHLTAEVKEKSTKREFLTLMVIDNADVTWKLDSQSESPSILVTTGSQSVRTNLSTGHVTSESHVAAQTVR